MSLKSLKTAPRGMELDCTMFDDAKFIAVDEAEKPICIRTGDIYRYLTKFGTWTFDENAKCVIFPKGKTTWTGFVPPCKFKDGDIVATMNGSWIGITEGGENSSFIPTHCVIKSNGKFEAYFDRKERWIFSRLAIEEEKQKLFDAIKANGYKWNAETNTLEKLIEPKFKVGDKVKDKNNFIYTVLSIEDWGYILDDIPRTGIAFDDQDNYELVSNKFDITTLKPFESKVLVRDTDHYEWEGAVFGRYDGNSFFTIGGIDWKYCIPYEGNEYLFGKTDDCNDYYKTWK